MLCATSDMTQVPPTQTGVVMDARKPENTQMAPFFARRSPTHRQLFRA